MVRTILVFLLVLLPLTGMAASLKALQAGELAGAWLIQDKEAPSLKVSLYVLTGERDGTAQEGLAHYVEHLAWENMREDDAEPQAGHSNAFTSSDLMGYWLSGEPDQLQSLLSDLLKVFDPLTVSEKFALEEREIIQREYDYRERENWRAAAWNGVMRRLHADDPRQRDVGGSPESIDSYNLADGIALHSQTHTPQNSVLVIRGNVSKGQANKVLKKQLGRSANKKHKIPRGLHADYQMAAAGRDVQGKEYEGVTQAELLYAKVVQLDGVQPMAELVAEAEVLSRLLMSRLPGGLDVPLHYDNFYASDFSVDISVLDQQHLLMYVEAVPDVGVSLQTLLEAIESELNNLAVQGLANASVETIIAREIEDISDFNQPRFQGQLLRQYLELRSTPIDIKEQLKALKKIDHKVLSERLRAVAGEGRVVAELVQ